VAEGPTLRLEIVTPDGQVYGDAVEMVVVPGVDGELGILKGHQPLVSLLAVGESRVRHADTTVEHIATGIGYVQVLFDKVLVVVDHAELAGQIDAARAEAAKVRAEERLRLSDDPGARAEVDFFRAEQALKRAENRLRVADHAH
jgi:F-type H+-transporting ATPase subunit epsilon